jgi:hypothetical protein
MKCHSCGADVSPGGVRCEFCGSTLAPPESPSRLAVFEQIKRSPQYERRNAPERLAALPKYPALAKVFMVAFPLVFIGMSVFVMLGMWAMAGVLGLAGGAVGGRIGAGVSLLPLLMSLCSASFVVIGVLMLVHFRKKFREYDEAPTLARAAVLVGKRPAVSGGSGDSSASTRYFLTAEFEDGSRAEFETFGAELYGRAVEGDAGVLFTRGPAGLDFDRVVGSHS